MDGGGYDRKRTGGQEVMDAYNQARQLTEILRLRRRIEELERLATQRGARMQIMRDWMINNGQWNFFSYDRREAADWFDADGVPAQEGRG